VIKSREMAYPEFHVNNLSISRRVCKDRFIFCSSGAGLVPARFGECTDFSYNSIKICSLKIIINRV
jgi:hypothetical protein